MSSVLTELTNEREKCERSQCFMAELPHNIVDWLA
jgi:hypothetical protein